MLFLAEVVIIGLVSVRFGAAYAVIAALIAILARIDSEQVVNRRLERKKNAKEIVVYVDHEDMCSHNEEQLEKHYNKIKTK